MIIMMIMIIIWPTYLDLHSRGWNAISISDLDLKTQNGAKRPCIPAQFFLFVHHKIELIHSFLVMSFLSPKVAWKVLKLWIIANKIK